VPASGGGQGVLAPIRCPLVVLELLMVTGVLVLAGPALVLGAQGLSHRTGHYSSDVTADRVSLALLVAVRLVTLTLVVVLSLVVLVCAVGAIVRDLEMPGLVSVFFVLDLLLAALVVLTFGRRDRRRGRRRGTPAAR
jgi:lysylphosphatidylglycerol synthetase-like protein (DUF2156 family)